MINRIYNIYNKHITKIYFMLIAFLFAAGIVVSISNDIDMEKQDENQKKSKKNPPTVYHRARELFACGDYHKAIIKFNSAKKEFPIKSTYMIGRCYKKLLEPSLNWSGIYISKLESLTEEHKKYYFKAISSYDEVYKKNPESNLADDALGMSAGLDFRVGNFNRAAKKYLTLIEEYPFSDVKLRFFDAKLTINILARINEGKFNHYNMMLDSKAGELLYEKFDSTPDDPNLLKLIDKYISLVNDLYFIKHFNLIDKYLDQNLINDQRFLIELMEEAYAKGEDRKYEKLRVKMGTWYHPLFDYKQAMALLQKGNTLKAEQLFSTWLDEYKYQNHPLTLSVLFFYTECLFKQEKYNAFIKIAEEYLLKYEENLPALATKIYSNLDIEFNFTEKFRSLDLQTFPVLGFPILERYFSNHQDKYQFYIIKKRIFHALGELKEVPNEMSSPNIKLMAIEYKLAKSLYEGNFKMARELYKNFMTSARNHRVSLKFREKYFRHISPYIELAQIITFIKSDKVDYNSIDALIEKYSTKLRANFAIYEFNYIQDTARQREAIQLREEIIRKISTPGLLQELSDKKKFDSFADKIMTYSSIVYSKKGLIMNISKHSWLEKKIIIDFLSKYQINIHSSANTITNSILNDALYLFVTAQSKKSQHLYFSEALLLYYKMWKVPSPQLKIKFYTLLKKIKESNDSRAIKNFCVRLQHQ